jgi:hypothetical protein
MKTSPVKANFIVLSADIFPSARSAHAQFRQIVLAHARCPSLCQHSELFR